MSDASPVLEEEPTCYPTKGKYIVERCYWNPTRLLVGSKDERRFWKTLDHTPRKKAKLVASFFLNYKQLHLLGLSNFQQQKLSPQPEI